MPLQVSSDQYLQQLISLQPPGQALPVETGRQWTKVLLGLSDELARVFNSVAAIMDAVDPFTTHELLIDWERVLGLPVSEDLAGTQELRRQAVLHRLRRRGDLTAQFIIDTAAAFGFAITITEFSPSCVGAAVCGDEMIGADASYYFEVHSPQFVINEAYVGAAVCGDPMGTIGGDGLQFLINLLKPIHKTPVFIYGA